MRSNTLHLENDPEMLRAHLRVRGTATVRNVELISRANAVGQTRLDNP